MNDTEAKPSGLEAMRVPFPASLISKLPKPTKAQTDAVKADFKAGIKCEICGTWHHPKVVHLDYVGHAAITQRLLDVDQLWSWEPVAFDADGLPKLDQYGGLWIRLTVLGVTRLGYGDAVGKPFGPTAIKEAIGDAIRNACMRFGTALELWHKGDWEADTLPDGDNGKQPGGNTELPPCPDANLDKWIGKVRDGKASADELLPFAQAKHTLTTEQIERINNFVTEFKNPPIDTEFVREMEGAEQQ